MSHCLNSKSSSFKSLTNEWLSESCHLESFKCDNPGYKADISRTPVCHAREERELSISTEGFPVYILPVSIQCTSCSLQNILNSWKQQGEHGTISPSTTQPWTPGYHSKWEFHFVPGKEGTQVRENFKGSKCLNMYIHTKKKAKHSSNSFLDYTNTILNESLPSTYISFADLS